MFLFTFDLDNSNILCYNTSIESSYEILRARGMKMIRSIREWAAKTGRRERINGTWQRTDSNGVTMQVLCRNDITPMQMLKKPDCYLCATDTMHTELLHDEIVVEGYTMNQVMAMVS